MCWLTKWRLNIHKCESFHIKIYIFVTNKCPILMFWAHVKFHTGVIHTEWHEEMSGKRVWSMFESEKRQTWVWLMHQQQKEGGHRTDSCWRITLGGPITCDPSVCVCDSRGLKWTAVWPRTVRRQQMIRCVPHIVRPGGISGSWRDDWVCFKSVVSWFMVLNL